MHPRTTVLGRPLESRGGWAFFGRLLVWATRNNRRPARSSPDRIGLHF